MIETYGPHKVRHGDVTKGIADLMGADRAQIMYSDPPWGEGNIKYWATMNEKMNGVRNEPAPLSDFLGAVFGHARDYVDRYLLIEYGVRWADQIQERAIAAGFTPRGITKLIYSSENLPLDLHLFTRGEQPVPEGYLASIEGTKGYETLRRAVAPLAAIVKADNPNAIILDPCCGMGYTAQSAIDNGLAFRGNELNRARLDKTVNRLRRAQGLKPIKPGQSEAGKAA